MLADRLNPDHEHVKGLIKEAPLLHATELRIDLIFSIRQPHLGWSTDGPFKGG